MELISLVLLTIMPMARPARTAAAVEAAAISAADFPAGLLIGLAPGLRLGSWGICTAGCTADGTVDRPAFAIISD